MLYKKGTMLELRALAAAVVDFPRDMRRLAYLQIKVGYGSNASQLQYRVTYASNTAL